MTVTSITTVAVSFRTDTGETQHTNTTAAKAPAISANDSVELSQQAAAEARSTDPSARAETLLKAFDTDGDGVVTKTEFMTGAMEVLKRASVSFHHQRVGRGEVTPVVSAEQPVSVASLAIREYTVVSRVKNVAKV
jgi:hypothetical protein